MKTKYLIIIISALLLTIVFFKVTNLPELFYSNDDSDDVNRNYSRSLNIIIPESKRDSYLQLSEFEKMLNIKSLLDTKDSIAIRFWLHPKGEPIKYLISMKLDNNEWSAMRYIIKYNPKEDRDIKITSESVTPRMDWAGLIAKLNHYGIFTLPDDKNNKLIENVDDFRSNWFDGITYWVEVINDKYYRFYTCTNPAEYGDQFYEYYYFNEIAKLFELEFEIIVHRYL